MVSTQYERGFVAVGDIKRRAQRQRPLMNPQQKAKVLWCGHPGSGQ